MLKLLSTLWFTHVTLPRYRRAAEAFGDMLSYSYMGEAVGFKNFAKRVAAYQKALIKRNLKPWTYDEMAGVGWGYPLPELRPFHSQEEQISWRANFMSSQSEVVEIQKTNLAKKFFS